MLRLILPQNELPRRCLKTLRPAGTQANTPHLFNSSMDTLAIYIEH